ncbi:hypothetical protein [Teretinema zuelzerae]|nr:hypothetical protein [Teretinema zuelzerae]
MKLKKIAHETSAVFSIFFSFTWLFWMLLGAWAGLRSLFCGSDC